MRTSGVAALVLLALALGGCGSSAEEQVGEMTGVIVKTAASSQGQATLAKAGVEVSGPLNCTAEPAGDDFTVSCSATSVDGRAVTLTGTATSVPGGTSVAGQFRATANGQEVWSAECRGTC